MKFVFTPLVCVATDEADMLSEDMNPKLQGLDAFENTMCTLGLSERRPVPDPVTFDQPDPLGASVVASKIMGSDMASSTSKCLILFLTVQLI